MKLLKEFVVGYKRFYLVGLLVYLVSGSILIPYFFHGADIDFLSYCHIGQKYYLGYSKEAINAYWSPLLAWLMIPSYVLEVDPIHYYRYLNLVAGFASLLVFVNMLEATRMSAIAKISCFATLVLSIGYFHLTINKPDFLLVFPASLYFYLVGKKEEWMFRPNSFLMTSLLALGCYFAKSYFLFFIVAHLSLYTAFIFFFIKRDRRVLFFYAKTMALFLLGVGLWVSILSWKYDRFIVSSSGSYNFAIMTPQGVNHFYFSLGLTAPPEVHSLYIFEDPTYLNASRPSPLSSKEAFFNQLDIYKYNLTNAYYLFKYFSYLSIGLVLLLLAVPFVKRNKDRWICSYYSYSALLYIVGYVLVLIDDQRYVYCVLLVSMLVVFMVLDEYLENFFSNKLFVAIILCLVFLQFAKNVYYDFEFWNRTRAYFLYSTQLSKKLAEQFPEFRNAHMATNQGRYGANITTLTAFYAGAKSYSEFCYEHTDAYNQETLMKYGIHYLFFFKNPDPVLCENCTKLEIPSYLKDAKIIFQDSKINLVVLEIRKH